MPDPAPSALAQHRLRRAAREERRRLEQIEWEKGVQKRREMLAQRRAAKRSAETGGGDIAAEGADPLSLSRRAGRSPIAKTVVPEMDTREPSKRCACGCDNFTKHPWRAQMCASCYHAHDLVGEGSELHSATFASASACVADSSGRASPTSETPPSIFASGSTAAPLTKGDFSLKEGNGRKIEPQSSPPPLPPAKTVPSPTKSNTHAAAIDHLTEAVVISASGAGRQSTPLNSDSDNYVRTQSGSLPSSPAATRWGNNSQIGSSVDVDQSPSPALRRRSAVALADGGIEYQQQVALFPTSSFRRSAQRSSQESDRSSRNGESEISEEDELVTLRLTVAQLQRQVQLLRDSADAQQRAQDAAIADMESEQRARLVDLREMYEIDVQEETDLARREIRHESAARMSELNARIEHLELKLERANDEARAMREYAENGDHDATSGDQGASNLALKAALEKAVKRGKSLKRKLRDANNRAQADILMANESLADALRKVVDKEASLSTLKSDMAELRQERDELRDTLSDTQQDLADAKKALSQLQESPARLHVVQELAETETHYLANLRRTVEYFMKPMIAGTSVGDVPCPSRLSANGPEIFGNIQDLLEITIRVERAISRRMETWNSRSTIASVFVEIDRSAYLNYMRGHQAAIDLVSELSEKKSVATWLRAVVDRHVDCGRLDLLSFLIMPVQRILRYRMLLEDLLKHTEEDHPDYTELRQAVDFLLECADAANDHMREEAARADAMRIEKNLVGSASLLRNLELGRRTFIREGLVHKISRKTTQSRVLILFSGLLLVTSPDDEQLVAMGGQKKAEKLRYLFHRAIPLDRLRVKPMSDTATMQHAFQIISDDKSFVVLCSSAATKENWINGIEQARSKVSAVANVASDDDEQGAPVWIPDSAAKCCMACQATFTVVRRRHHCRYCGKVVCGACTKDRIALPRSTNMKKARVCNSCFVDIKAIWSRDVADTADTAPYSGSDMAFDDRSPRTHKWSLSRTSSPASRSAKEISPGSSAKLRSWRSSTQPVNLDDVATKYRRGLHEASPNTLHEPPNEAADRGGARVRRSRTIGDAADASALHGKLTVATVTLNFSTPLREQSKKIKLPSELQVGKARRSLLKRLPAQAIDYAMLMRKGPNDFVRMDDRKPLFVYQAISDNENELRIILLPESEINEIDGRVDLVPPTKTSEGPALPRLRPGSKRRSSRHTQSGAPGAEQRSKTETLRTQRGLSLVKDVRNAVRSGDLPRLKDLVKLDNPSFAEAMARQQQEQLHPSHRRHRFNCVPFVDAVGESRIECLLYLLEYAVLHQHALSSDADVVLDWLNATDDHGEHVLHVCFAKRSGDLVAERMTHLLLFGHDASSSLHLDQLPHISSAYSNSSGNTPLHYWARYCDWTTWREVGSALLAAAAVGDYTITERASAIKELVNAKNAAGDRALHCCVMNAALSGRVQQRSDMVALLCEAGADPNAVNSDGFTALHTLVLATATQLNRVEQFEAGRSARPWERSLGGNIKVVSPEEITHVAAELIAAGADLVARDGSSELLTPEALAAQLITAILESAPHYKSAGVSEISSVLVGLQSSPSSTFEVEVTVRSLLALRRCLISAEEVKLHFESCGHGQLFLGLARHVLPRPPDANCLIAYRQMVLVRTLQELQASSAIAEQFYRQIAEWRYQSLSWRFARTQFDMSIREAFILWEAGDKYDSQCLDGFIVPERCFVGTVPRTILMAAADPTASVHVGLSIGDEVVVCVQEYRSLTKVKCDEVVEFATLFAGASLDSESCLVGILGLEKISDENLRIIQDVCRRQSLHAVLEDDSAQISWDQLLSMATQVARGVLSYHMIAVAASESRISLSRLFDAGQPGNWELTAMPDGLTAAVRAAAAKFSQALVHGRITADSFQVDTNLQLRLEFAFPNPFAGKFDAAMLWEVGETGEDSEGIAGQWMHYTIPDNAKFALPSGATVFSAPEYFFMSTKDGKRLQLTPRADVYSVGMLIWILVARAVAGRYVEPFPVDFNGEVSDETLSKIAHGLLRPTDILGAPLPLLALIRCCLRRQPSERPKMRTVLHELGAIERAFVLQRREWLAKHENLPSEE